MGMGNHVDSAYLDLCFAQYAVALVIFAHFAALLSLKDVGSCEVACLPRTWARVEAWDSPHSPLVYHYDNGH